MKKNIGLSFALAFFTLPNLANAQVSPQELQFADRVAILALNDKCHVFDDSEKRALFAFMMQARGSLLRNDTQDQRIRLIASQAKNGATARNCNEAIVQSEVARVKKSYKSWRMQINADYPGIKRNWHVTRGGVDNWRAFQDVGGNTKAGFIVYNNAMVFALETNNKNYATARLYYRDVKRYSVPRANGNLLAPLRNGALIANVSGIENAISKERISSKPRDGALFVFSKDLNQKILSLDPRECFEIELVKINGGVDNYLIEVGDMLPAFALGAEF